ncbi:enoyl-CoA hydratase/isomerase family protein [Sphingomonas profundi]|uniref:enoyl-CoA hydratase/isomerase family protein n=1 Tax=Alterirhizorhabdus profundi TaxID=2681549 RepID=UPI0012E74371|nr:enoyl-CoA hydratase-related protein [Sphingomonas profundi]
MSIDLAIADAVATVTINRPEKKNAVTLEMREQLWTAFEGLSENDDVRAVVLTGSGGSFCSGMDVGEMGGGGPALSMMKMRRLHRIARSIYQLKKPVVAAVDGACVGAGWSFALCCDFVLASDRAKFAQVFGKIGFAPDAGAVWLLTRQVGTMRAKEITYSGRTVGAEEARALGLVMEVLPAGGLLARARALAASLAAQAPLSLAMAKRQFQLVESPALDPFLEMEYAMQPLMSRTQDHHEGVAAFRERREPIFKGA